MEQCGLCLDDKPIDQINPQSCYHIVCQGCVDHIGSSDQKCLVSDSCNYAQLLGVAVKVDGETTKETLLRLRSMLASIERGSFQAAELVRRSIPTDNLWLEARKLVLDKIARGFSSFVASHKAPHERAFLLRIENKQCRYALSDNRGNVRVFINDTFQYKIATGHTGKFIVCCKYNQPGSEFHDFTMGVNQSTSLVYRADSSIVVSCYRGFREGSAIYDADKNLISSGLCRDINEIFNYDCNFNPRTIHQSKRKIDDKTHYYVKMLRERDAQQAAEDYLDHHRPKVKAIESNIEQLL